MIEPKRKSGRCANGAERDKGSVWHAVERGNDFGKALCGAEPGRRSSGWSPAVAGRFPEINCPRCRKKMATAIQK